MTWYIYLDHLSGFLERNRHEWSCWLKEQILFDSCSVLQPLSHHLFIASFAPSLHLSCCSSQESFLIYLAYPFLLISHCWRCWWATVSDSGVSRSQVSDTLNGNWNFIFSFSSIDRHSFLVAVSDPAFVCASLSSLPSMLEIWKANSFFLLPLFLWMICIFKCGFTWVLTFWRLSLFYFIPPSLWKLFFDNQSGLLFFLLSSWLFTFCPLKLKPFGVCLEFWQFKFKRKPSWGNLFWHIHILTQSFAGLMGWLKTSLCFSHVHLCVWG